MTYADPKLAGTPTTYISGIWGTALTGTPAQVFVNADGQLGVMVSSERYKTGINPLGAASNRLSQLRPVSFHLKADRNDVVQYGLIAEEVDKVYPELVIRDNDRKIRGVRYDELSSMLLNEMQKQESKIASLEQELAEIHAALAAMGPNSRIVSQR